jgi:hypothetical protein
VKTRLDEVFRYLEEADMCLQNASNLLKGTLQDADIIGDQSLITKLTCLCLPAQRLSICDAKTKVATLISQYGELLETYERRRYDIVR